jgi:hypothetical protein
LEVLAAGPATDPDRSPSRTLELHMGAWATAAWDNDGAADWFGDMFDATSLANYVRETLQRDVEEYDEEVRAAAYMVVALGRVYIWPIDDLDNDLALAIAKLEEIKALENYQEVPDFVKAIDEEIAVLKSRLKKPSE